MKRWKRILINQRDNIEEYVEEEEYRISKGCCYFHDQAELDEFNDADDDNF